MAAPLRHGYDRDAALRALRELGWTVERIADAFALSTSRVHAVVRDIAFAERPVKLRRRAHQWSPVAATPHSTPGGAACWCLDAAHA